MQRDKVLGLSLAILLIGFAGAFCFRNETSSIFNGPKLQNPRALDEAIADKEGPKPYSNDLQGANPRVSPTGVTLEGIVPEGTAAGNARSPGMAPNNSGWELPDFLKPKTADPQRNLSQTRTTPEPIGSQPQPRDSRQDLWMPKHNQAWEATSAQTVSSNRMISNGQTGMHQVVSGDTLTGLAARYLGSSTRYLEIYEANRDILRSPNDLRVGMTLRVPDARSATNSATPVSSPSAQLSNERGAWSNGFDRTPARNISTGGNNARTPANGRDPFENANPNNYPPQKDPLGLPSKHFVPVKRSPFVPQSSMSRPGPTPYGSLSQNILGHGSKSPKYEFFPKAPPQTANGRVDGNLPILR